MSRTSDLRFLVVDDFSVMRHLIRSLLKEIGARGVEEAEDGQIAFQMLKAGCFDFVVSDINMPKMNGFALLKAIREDSRLKQLPVLMVTAEARKEDILMAAQYGASGYILKPFSRTTLEEKLTNILQKMPDRS